MCIIKDVFTDVKYKFVNRKLQKLNKYYLHL